MNSARNPRVINAATPITHNGGPSLIAPADVRSDLFEWRFRMPLRPFLCCWGIKRYGPSGHDGHCGKLS